MDDASSAESRSIMDRICSNSPAVAALEVEILSASPGAAKLQLTIRPGMLNGQGICYGGALFSFADTTAALAALSRNRLAVTQNAAISYIDSARVGERLVATATEIHRGARSAIYDVRIDADNRVIALLRAHFRILDGAVL
jgi:acyl-CoA thioesterase